MQPGIGLVGGIGKVRGKVQGKVSGEATASPDGRAYANRGRLGAVGRDVVSPAKGKLLMSIQLEPKIGFGFLLAFSPTCGVRLGSLSSFAGQPGASLAVIPLRPSRPITPPYLGGGGTGVSSSSGS